MYSYRNAVTSVWRKRIATIATAHAASDSTSCTNPRMKPPIAAAPTIRNTMMSKPVTRLNLRRAHDPVNELGQACEAGIAQAGNVLESVFRAIAQFEPQLGRFTQP